jgi:hypothetical protein
VGFEVWIGGTGEAPRATARQIVSALAERGVKAVLLEAGAAGGPAAPGPAGGPAAPGPAGAAPEAVGVLVAAASTATLKMVTSILGQASGRGLVVDLTRTPPRISDREGLAPRSLLILWQDGRQDLREGLNDEQAGYVARSALATAGL